jgi:hypothetical protein
MIPETFSGPVNYYEHNYDTNGNSIDPLNTDNPPLNNIEFSKIFVNAHPDGRSHSGC